MLNNQNFSETKLFKITTLAFEAQSSNSRNWILIQFQITYS